MQAMPNKVMIPGPPFPQSAQLNRDTSTNLAIRCGIEDSPQGWTDHLSRDLTAAITDRLYPYLWLFARKNGSHIDPLHQQILKKRSIIIAEDPKLHLAWHYDTIYTKPLPEYLLNHSIWSSHIPATTKPSDLPYDKYRAALGFLRSYSHLIRHESDFIIAQKADLLPKDITFLGFQSFMIPFRRLADDQVAQRYHYGQLRLSRLNWAVRTVYVLRLLRLIQPNEKDTEDSLSIVYHEQFWQASQRLQHYAAPLIFVFAALSLILSSMQVVLAAKGEQTWSAFVDVCWGFSVATILFITILVAGVMVFVVGVLGAQAQFAVRKKWKDVRSGKGRVDEETKVQ